ncbi:MAG: CBS domain-containing protein [Solirubrobacteraceae bacterium]|jgi:CBS-domain-containing membrane protein
MTSPPSAVTGSRRGGSRRRGAVDLRAITVGEVMHPGVVSCAQTATAAELVGMMSSARAHCVAVTGLPREADDPPRIWGILSTLDVIDILHRAGS